MKLWHAWAHRMWAEGKTQTEIARALNRSVPLIRYTLDIKGEKAKTKARVIKQRALKKQFEKEWLEWLATRHPLTHQSLELS